MKKELFRTFLMKYILNQQRKNNPTNKMVCNHIDEIWSIDLADMVDHKILNNKGFRYIFVIIDNFSNFV